MFWQSTAGTSVTDNDGCTAIEGVEVGEVGGRNGGFQKLAVGIEMQDIGAEFLSNPDFAIGVNDEGFDVKIGAGEIALGGSFVLDIERNEVVRVAQLDEPLHIDAAVTPLIPNPF